MGIPPAPKSVDELLSQYDGYITGCIRKITRHRAKADDIQDLKQDIMVRALDKHYLDRYDPGKAAFKTYLFCLIRTVVVNNFEKRQHDALANACSLVLSEERRSGNDSGALDGYVTSPLTTTWEYRAELLQEMADRSFEQRQIAHDLGDRIAKRLAMQRNPGPARAFQLMREGKPATEIARIMHVGPTCVSAYLKRIKAEAASIGRAA